MAQQMLVPLERMCCGAISTLGVGSAQEMLCTG